MNAMIMHCMRGAVSLSLNHDSRRMSHAAWRIQTLNKISIFSIQDDEYCSDQPSQTGKEMTFQHKNLKKSIASKIDSSIARGQVDVLQDSDEENSSFSVFSLFTLSKWCSEFSIQFADKAVI